MTDSSATLSNESIYELLRSWHHTRDKKRRWTDRTQGNKATLAHMEAVLANVEASLPVLQAWCAEYLATMPVEEQLRGWLMYGIRNREGNGGYGKKTFHITHQPASFETHWKLFFRKAGAEPDSVMVGGKEFDISYRHYVSLLDELEKKWRSHHYSRYDEPSVVAIHEGKPCDDMFCSLCDETLDAWRAHLQKTYRSKNNIFINSACGEEFVSLWLASVATMTDEEKGQIHWVWPPPSTYFDPSCDGEVVGQSLDAYLAFLVDSRYKRYYTYSARPAVEFERVAILQQALRAYDVPNFGKEGSGANRWNDLFLFVFRFVQYAPYMLYMDKKFCREMIAVYEGLPDD